MKLQSSPHRLVPYPLVFQHQPDVGQHAVVAAAEAVDEVDEVGLGWEAAEQP